METTATTVSPFQHLLVHAEELKLQNKHRDAIGVCESIVSTDLECSEAYEEIGDNYISLREYPKAKIALEIK